MVYIWITVNASVMKTITIEIDSSTAEEFNKFSPDTKTIFGETIAIALKKMINDATHNRHKEFLDAISSEAQKNGLTEEILNDLLKRND